MKDFISFIREQGVIGLAIGFILGGAVSQTVSALVESIINPLIGVIIPNTNSLSAASVTFFGATFAWGAFLVALIDLIVIAAVVFYGFKALKLEKLDKKKD